uniref:Odorant receptor n=1 Tax=Conogethes pinicolalis TaxID=1178461 RepID=A0A5B9GA08_9NEOP|nr:odorant receptor 36 [Conogethes pinicolalis]
MRNYVILRTFYEKIFLFGSGNFWYEENEIGDDSTRYYKAYKATLFTLYGLMTALEVMGAIFGDFPEDEKQDCIALAVAHTIVMLKIFSIDANTKLIRTMNRNMVEICEPYEQQKLMEEKFRMVKVNLAAYFTTVWGSTFCFVLEGFRKLYQDSHFVTAVTYYPSYNDNTIGATMFRLFITVVLLAMMVTMTVCVDCIIVVYLILLKYKFIALRHYFENLAEEFSKMNQANPRLAAERLTDGFVEGVKMHIDLLRMAEDIDQAFGTVMALQLCLSSGSAVSLLLQFAVNDNLTFVAGMKILLFILAIFILLGLFLCNAGEITYQASLLTDAIFYCGWHACAPQTPPQRDIRRLVVLPCAQSQRPLIMKAFNMFELSYGTFLQVCYLMKSYIINNK